MVTKSSGSSYFVLKYNKTTELKISNKKWYKSGKKSYSQTEEKHDSIEQVMKDEQQKSDINGSN